MTLSEVSLYILNHLSILFSYTVSIQTKIEMVSNSAIGKHVSVSSKIPLLLIVKCNAKLNPKKMLIGAAHNGQVCSTWGNFHFSTFDGDFFQLPYTCNYILTTMCDSTQSEFNIQMRRENIGERPEITAFTIKLGGIVIMLQQGNITVNNKAWVFLSHSHDYSIQSHTFFMWCLTFS